MAKVSEVLSLYKPTSTIDAFMLSSNISAYYMDVQARLGYSTINPSGDVMNGTLTLSSNPSSSNHAATKQYADNISPRMQILSITYPGSNNYLSSANVGAVYINGINFDSNCSVFIDKYQANSVTYISSTSLAFTYPTLPSGNYRLAVTNPNKDTTVHAPGITYSGL